MYKYKTTDGSERVVPGVGQTVNGVIESDHEIESPVLELVETPAPPPQNGIVGTAPTQSPGAVNQAAPVVPLAPDKSKNEEQ